LGEFSPLVWLCLREAFLKNYKSSPIFVLLFHTVKVMSCFWRKLVGIHFGQLYHKHIWSPCQQGTQLHNAGTFAVSKLQSLPFIMHMLQYWTAVQWNTKIITVTLRDTWLQICIHSQQLWSWNMWVVCSTIHLSIVEMSMALHTYLLLRCPWQRFLRTNRMIEKLAFE
jgi:hypothetical protein